MVNDNIVMEHARICFRNFGGNEGKFNPKGRRNFCVLLDDESAIKLANDGWNVKYLKPREEGEAPQAYMQVSVDFAHIPPKVILVTSKGKTQLTEDKVDILDWAEITNVDLIIRPYNWTVNGATGTKAYAKSIYVTLYEDEFDRKYMDVPDSAQNTL